MAHHCSRCGEEGHNIATCPVPLGHRFVLAMNFDEGYAQWQPCCVDCSWEGDWSSDRDAAASEGLSHQEDTRDE
jgi:hypothetical protein